MARFPNSRFTQIVFVSDRFVAQIGSITGMTKKSHKLSVSVPSDLIRFAESYRLQHHLDSRSQVIAKALERLREKLACSNIWQSFNI